MRRLLLVPFSFLTLALLACNTLFPPKPPVAWDTSPDVLIIRNDTSGGMMYDPNGMPDVQIWGDGHMVWVANDPNGNGGRKVFTATLTPAQMTALLQKFVDGGFFGLKDFYEPNAQVYDAPSTCLYVNLSSVSKSVCDQMGNAPAKFYELERELTNNVTAADYIPAQGYLTAIPFDSTPNNSQMEWPAQSLGLSLQDTGGGVWVEGEALELAWRVVNTSPYNAVVGENGRYYTLTLLIPGITRQPPPQVTPNP
jgi:hypothetical protein